jgi:excisionase family DNA binding protein
MDTSIGSTEYRFSTKDAAHFLHVTKPTVIRWADKGMIPSIRLPNGRRRFRKADLEQVIERGRAS